MHDIENLLMVGPNPFEAATGQSCGTCGDQPRLLWTAADAVRVRVGEDWQYEPGSQRVLVCRTCADKIHAAWLVIPDA
jgi:hypothetical protein